MTAYAGKLPDRRTLWQTYQRWVLKNEIVLSTRNPPPPDYDAHLLADSYRAATRRRAATADDLRYGQRLSDY